MPLCKMSNKTVQRKKNNLEHDLEKNVDEKKELKNMTIQEFIKHITTLWSSNKQPKIEDWIGSMHY